MAKEQTPKTPRSIVRNHSPYCESAGSIVQEGFVAARVRALQGFSDQAQNVTRSHYPPTTCPLHVYKSRSPPSPSFAPKLVLTGTDLPDRGTVKRFHTRLLSNDHQNLVNAPGRSTGLSDDVFSFQPQEQQSFVGPATPHKSYVRDRGAQVPCPILFKDTVPSSNAQSNQDHVTAPSTPPGPPSELDQVDDVPVRNSLPSEKSILSPHAIQADLIEPQAPLNCLPQAEDHNNDYIHEQAVKPRGSIADKLDSMVEQGWVGGDTFGKVYSDDEFASHAIDSNFEIRDTRLDSRSDCLNEIPRLEKVPSYSECLSDSNAEMRSESHHSTGQGSQPHVEQKEPRNFVYHVSQKGRKREVKRSHAMNTPQRSSSDSGAQYLKTEFATQKGKRRAWTLQHLGRSTSDHSHIQPAASPGIWPSYAWDHRRRSMKLPPSRERSISKSGVDLTMLRDEQPGQDSTTLSKVSGSRRSSVNTKASTQSASRSASFFKKFPWYKVALVDKQPMVYTSSKGGCRNNRTSRAVRAAHDDPTFNQIELSQGGSKPHTLVECGDETDENRQKTKAPLHQVPIDQQAIDAMTSYYKASSQSSLPLMVSPQEMNEREFPEQVVRASKYPEDSHSTCLNIGEDRPPQYPHQVLKDMVEHADSPIRTGRFGMQPTVSLESGSSDARFESSITGDVLQSFQPQGPEVKEHSCLQPYTSDSKPMNLHADRRLKKGSFGSEIASAEEVSTARFNLSHGPRSDVVNFTPKRLGSGTGSLPASVQRSDQHGPGHREAQGGGKGIKKIQVTVTFDGAEDLLIEATLTKKDGQERWRTMA